tara:strand:- start:195 stop:1553 length:1359 start_codon:yes stop_codon:yes gene_type:complete
MKKLNQSTKTILLKSILERFNIENVPYCILRNHELLPEEFRNDIDILIEESSKKVVANIIQDCAEDLNWDYRQRGTNLYFLLFYLDENDLDFFRLDIVTKLESGGVEYFPAKRFLESNKISKKGFKIPDPTLELFHILAHFLLGPEYNRDKYSDKISSQIQNKDIDWDVFYTSLKEIFPVKIPETLIRNFQTKNTRTILNRKYFYKYLMLFKLKRLYFPFFQFFKKWLNRIYRYSFPKGKFIVLIGPDGSGKSTASKSVVELIQMFHFLCAHIHLGFRPAFLPTKREILFWRKELPSKNKEKNDKKLKTNPKNKMGYLKFLYYSIDYLFGYLIKIRPILCKKGFVITERYFSDYLAGTRKNPKVTTPNWFIKLIYFFLPKPYMVIMLYDIPERIFERRKELSIDEIKEHIEKYKKIDMKQKKLLEIKTDVPTYRIAVQILDAILGKEISKRS